MTAVIDVAGPDEVVRPDARAGRARPDRGHRRGARLPRPERRGQVHHHPGPARAAARRRRAPRGCSAATRGATPSTLHRRLAYVPGDVSLWPNLTGGEVIDLLGRLRGGLDQKRRAELLERFELDPTKKGRAYSKGNRQKVALVAALASDVELLILDEPTSGPGPADGGGVPGVRRGGAATRGRTVLLSSHILSEVEALCDRVSIIRAGAHGRDRHAGRAAAPDPHLDHAPSWRGRPTGLDRPARRARPGRRAATGCSCEVDTDALDERARAAGRRRGAQPGQPAADAGGAVPAALRGRGQDWRGMPARSGPARRGRAGHGAGLALAGTGRAARLALRRDRIVLLGLGVRRSRPHRSSAYSPALPDRGRAAASRRSVQHDPSLLALNGPVFDDRASAALTAWRILGFVGAWSPG